MRGCLGLGSHAGWDWMREVGTSRTLRFLGEGVPESVVFSSPVFVSGDSQVAFLAALGF